ncbi:MAG TPA: TolC family protein [Steroidobacteraceae bacterium]|jgi:outer membrane protein TolC
MRTQIHCRHLGCLLVSALSACASAPPPAPIDPAGTAAAFSARRLEQLAPELPTPSSSWDRAQWLQAALLLNPQLAEARAQVAAAVAGERTAAEHPNPTLNLFTEYVGGAAHSANWLYGLSLDFLLRRPGERARARHSAAVQTALAKSSLADSIWSVRASLRQALLDVASSRDEAALLATLIAERQTLLDSDRARAAAGDIARTQLLSDELELARAQQRLRHEQARGVDAVSRLAAAVGVPQSTLDSPPAHWDEWADVDALHTSSLDQPRSAALIGRPEMVQALREYDLAEIGLQNEIAKRWPEVHLTPGYAWGDQGVREDPLNDFSQETALGVNFELPLFNQHQGPIGEALARRNAAGQHLIAVQAQLFEQIDRAELAWPRARAAWDDAVGMSAIADRQQAAEQRALEAGAGDRAAVTGAQLAATEAQLLRLAAAYDAQSAFGALEDAFRRPLQGSEGELSPPQVPQS